MKDDPYLDTDLVVQENHVLLRFWFVLIFRSNITNRAPALKRTRQDHDTDKCGRSSLQGCGVNGIWSLFKPSPPRTNDSLFFMHLHRKLAEQQTADPRPLMGMRVGDSLGRERTIIKKCGNRR